MILFWKAPQRDVLQTRRAADLHKSLTEHNLSDVGRKACQGRGRTRTRRKRSRTRWRRGGLFREWRSQSPSSYITVLWEDDLDKGRQRGDLTNLCTILRLRFRRSPPSFLFPVPASLPLPPWSLAKPGELIHAVCFPDTREQIVRPQVDRRDNTAGSDMAGSQRGGGTTP